MQSEAKCIMVTLFANRTLLNKAYYHRRTDHFIMDAVSRGWVQTFSKKERVRHLGDRRSPVGSRDTVALYMSPRRWNKT